MNNTEERRAKGIKVWEDLETKSPNIGFYDKKKKRWINAGNTKMVPYFLNRIKDEMQQLTNYTIDKLNRIHSYVHVIVIDIFLTKPRRDRNNNEKRKTNGS